MSPRRTLTALCLIAALTTCARARYATREAVPEHAPTATDVENPMASFARLVGGEWRVTFASGQSAFHAWHWGPGERSMRKMAYATDAATNPWAGEVLYWHPGRGEVRVLSLHENIPGVGRGVAEGTIRFDGETSIAFIDLDQPRGPRKLGQRQSFDGLDEYHELLLEDTGAGLQPLNELVFVRDDERPGAPPPVDDRASVELPERWQLVETLVGRTWETEGESASGSALRIRSTCEWAPSLEVVFARSVALHANGEAEPMIEAYLYQDVRTDALRCLALSRSGAVAEGEVTVLERGAIQLDLEVYEGESGRPHVARLELDGDGRLRTRVWSVEGAARALTIDVQHEPLDPSRGR